MGKVKHLKKLQSMSCFVLVLGRLEDSWEVPLDLMAVLENPRTTSLNELHEINTFVWYSCFCTWGFKIHRFCKSTSIKFDMIQRNRWRWKSIKLFKEPRGSQTYIGSVSTKWKCRRWQEQHITRVNYLHEVAIWWGKWYACCFVFGVWWWFRLILL